MGTWAEGNFDNDSALDFVEEIADTVAKEIAEPDGVEDIELVMAAVAVQKALVEHCHAPPPEKSLIESLKSSILKVYDREIDDLDPDPEYKGARRRVIEQTFDEYLGILE